MKSVSVSLSGWSGKKKKNIISINRFRRPTDRIIRPPTTANRSHHRKKKNNPLCIIQYGIGKIYYIENLYNRAPREMWKTINFVKVIDDHEPTALYTHTHTINPLCIRIIKYFRPLRRTQARGNGVGPHRRAARQPSRKKITPVVR